MVNDEEECVRLPGEPYYDYYNRCRQDWSEEYWEDHQGRPWRGLGNELIDHGPKVHDTWTNLALQEPPKDLVGRIIWSFGILGQLIISLATFPAALGAFLLEEGVQTYGMGAYMLSTAKQWDILDMYLHGYDSFIDGALVGAKTLATLSPITGGAVILYMDAAKMSAGAFRQVVDSRLLEQAEKDEKLREKLINEQKYGTLRLASVPSQAEIWIDGDNTELLTPETFKKMDVGSYDIQLRKYSASREEWDILSFTITLEAGRKKEIRARIPPTISSTPEGEEPEGTTDEPQLPDYIKAEVTGEYAIDGDTFITTTGERIRVLGIDAPEIGRPWSEESREALTILVEDKKISLRIQSHKPLDQYGRTLAICSSWKGDIAIFQLSSGLARVAYFEDDIFDYTKYYTAETIAKDRKIGIWS